METTPLRIYLHDIEGLVGAGQMDEAIAHCRHILQTFPKSIAVYRLLGKAYLENQRYSDAADVFQRVLSAVPDDFISHVGMSIIREDEGNLDASIWHMERAFETQPYNSAIQDELRRLYGHRDGMQPPKMRLTRGALARLYMKGDLYQQAIGELRAALAEDPQRPDLQALLARVYYMAGQRVEAVETCSTLLKKLPFCLDANVLLGAILPETERAQDAQNYRQRAISLDPYFSQAPSNAQTAENVPTNAVTLEKLIYSPDKSGATEGGQPAWATSLGVAFTEQKDGEALPDWLSASAETSITPEEGSTTGAVTPFAESGAPGTFPWESDSEETAPTQAEPAALDTIPEWMKDAGWGAATGEAKEGPVSFDLAEETAVPAEGELAPADIPDWLREAAPPGVLQQPPTLDEEKASEEVLPWLQETPPGPTDTIVSWLSETKSEATTPAEDAQPMPPAELFQPLESEETGLNTPGALAEAVEADIPDWLKETTPPVKAETSVEPTEASELPTWLQSGEEAAQAEVETELPDWLTATEAETSAISAEIPDWLKTETPAEGTTTVEIEQLAGSEEEIPDWLKSLPTTSETSAPPEAPPAEITPVEAVPSEAVLSEQPPLETIPEATAPGDTTTPTEDYPEWLKEVEAEIPEEAVETPQLEGVTEWLDTVNTGDLVTGPVGITDWLKDVDTGQDTSPSEPGPSAVDIFPWMREEKGEGTEEPPSQEIAPAVPTEELPDWMREIEAGIPAAGAVEEFEAAAEIEIPETIPPTAEVIPGEITPAFEGEIPDGLNLEDQDSALAWLEGLAAKQGVPEEELITQPEERLEAAPAVPAEEIPDWLKAVEAEVPEEIAPAAEVVAAVPTEEVPDWLKAAEAEVPEVIAPAAEVIPAEAVPAAEGGLPAGLDLTDQDAALAWLEGLAAKQGVPEEELITKPEERLEAAPAVPAEEVPDWLKAVEAEVPEVIAPAAEVIPAEAAPAAEGGLPAGLDLTDQDAALAWLEGLAAKQGAPEEELITKPEERLETAPAVPAEEVPDWLKTAVAEVPEEITPAAEVVAAVPAEEVPDWLKAAEAEVPEVIAPAAEVIPAEAAPAAEGGLPAGLDLTDQDAALAWLEGLAAKQGVPEEELITKPEERLETAPAVPAEEIPDWLKAAVAEVPENIAPVAEVVAAVPVEEVPDWLKAAEAEVPEEIAPAAEVVAAVPAEEVPDWLKAAEAEVPEVIAPAVEIIPAEAAPAAEGGLPAGLDLTDQDAALAWLEGLAAKQGASEEELITQPEERAETPSAWIAEDHEAAGVEVQAEIPAVPAEGVPEWLKAAVEEIDEATVGEIPPAAIMPEADTISTEAAPVEIASQSAEWIKETELPEWLEKTELAKPVEKAEPETELPGWIAEATSQETEIAWEPPKTPEPVEKEKTPDHARTNLNSASVGELERLPGIGFVVAQSIINHRATNGPFTRLEDLLNVPGIGPGTVEVLKNWITILPVKAEILEAAGPPLDPDHIILRQAHIALLQGDIPTAIKQYERLLSTMVLLNEIILDLQDALYRYPVDISIWQALGDAYMRNNQLQDALDAYTKAEELLR